MQNISLLVLFVALLATVLFPRESFAAIDCYECKDCETIDGEFDSKSAKVVTCNGSCQKIIQDETGVTRGCFGYGDTEGCKRVSATRTTTCTCNRNLCNVATTLKSPLIIVAIATVVMRIFF